MIIDLNRRPDSVMQTMPIAPNSHSADMDDLESDNDTNSMFRLGGMAAAQTPRPSHSASTPKAGHTEQQAPFSTTPKRAKVSAADGRDSPSGCREEQVTSPRFIPATNPKRTTARSTTAQNGSGVGDVLAGADVPPVEKSKQQPASTGGKGGKKSKTYTILLNAGNGGKHEVTVTTGMKLKELRAECKLRDEKVQLWDGDTIIADQAGLKKFMAKVGKRTKALLLTMSPFSEDPDNEVSEEVLWTGEWDGESVAQRAVRCGGDSELSEPDVDLDDQ
jgi:hypothetical protein